MSDEVEYVQSGLMTTEQKIREVLEKASREEYDVVIGMVSGGTDSFCAVDAYHRFHDDYDLPPIDVVVQTNTGTPTPQTLETAREFCAERGLPYIEVRNQKEGRMLAHRILEHGWPPDSQGGPTSGGHYMEFINRKLDTWDKVYSSFPGSQLCISGARKDESDRRASNLGDSAVDHGSSGDRHPRKTWVSPFYGILDGEKEQYIEKYNIPETPAYDWLGFSGDCTGCSFDDPLVVNEIEILSPELAYCLRFLAVWVYQRIRRGDIDQPMARCVWGTELEEEGQKTARDPEQAHRDLRWAGCSEPDCKASRANTDE